MLKIFKKNGFDVKIIEKQKWEKIPIKKINCQRSFLTAKQMIC